MPQSAFAFLRPLLLTSALVVVGAGCENPDPTAPVPLPDERPMPVWGQGFGKQAEQGSLSPTDAPKVDAATAQGASLFTNHCAMCHGANAAGGPMAPTLLSEATLTKSDALLASTVKVGKGAMPAFSGRLSDAQIATILAWVRKQPRPPAGGAPGAPKGAPGQAPGKAPEKAPAPGADAQKAPTPPAGGQPAPKKAPY